MFKKLILTVAFLVICASSSFAEYSGELTADSVVTARPGHFLGIIVITDATNPVTVDIYDSDTAVAGPNLIPTWTVTTSATDRIQAIGFNMGDVKYSKGIYVDITIGGGSVTYMVYYKPLE